MRLSRDGACVRVVMAAEEPARGRVRCGVVGCVAASSVARQKEWL